jgi:pentose-5-phosphate-3-epimerase
MISDPDFLLGQFAQAGADSFLVHWEGNNHLYRTIRGLRNLRNGSVSSSIRPLLRLGWAKFYGKWTWY